MSELKYLDGVGVKYVWRKLLEKVHNLYDNKLDNVVAKDNSISIENNNKIGVNISSETGNTVSVKSDGLYAKPEDTYRIEKVDDGYNTAVYHLKRIPFGETEGVDAGNQIVIPTDTAIISGQIVEKLSDGDWGQAGTYLELTNKRLEKVYISVGTASARNTADHVSPNSLDIPTAQAIVEYIEQSVKYNVGAGLIYEQNANSLGANLVSKTKLKSAAGLTTEVSGRTYPVYIDSNGRLAVNIPWTDSIPVRSVSGKMGIVTLSKSDVGLENVNNTSDADKPVSAATQAALNTKLDMSLKGQNSGIAELDENGKVPVSQLPSYVDDVVEYPNRTFFPSTGESGKIYIAIDTNTVFRWSGSTYVSVGSALTLGTTSSTAFRGDYGDTAYLHALNKGLAAASGLYKIATNAEGHVISTTPVTKSDLVATGFDGGSRDININGTKVVANPFNIVSGNGVTLSFADGTLTASISAISTSDIDTLL